MKSRFKFKVDAIDMHIHLHMIDANRKLLARGHPCVANMEEDITV